MVRKLLKVRAICNWNNCVILMDVMTPVMDGLTATKTIWSLEIQDAKIIPIIVMIVDAFRGRFGKVYGGRHECTYDKTN